VSRVDSPALKGTWLGTLLRFLNPVVKVLLASPLHWPLSRWFLLLSWTGSKSGKEFRTPVSYVEDEGIVYVTTGDRWPRFVIGNPTFRIRRHGRWMDAIAVPIDNPEQSRRVHMRIFERHGWFRFLAGIPRTSGHTDERAVERAIVAGRRLIRIE
jgi:hypothetical protein